MVGGQLKLGESFAMKLGVMPECSLIEEAVGSTSKKND